MEENVVEIYEGIVHRENFKKSPFRKVFENLFPFRQRYKDEGNDLMQGLVELFKHSLYGLHVRKDNSEFIKCKFQNCMETEYDDNALDYWRRLIRKYIVKLKKEDGLDCDIDIKNTKSSNLGVSFYQMVKQLWLSVSEKSTVLPIIEYITETQTVYVARKINGMF